MFEYLMLGDVRARKYSKTGARTCSILEKFAFDTTLIDFHIHIHANVRVGERPDYGS